MYGYGPPIPRQEFTLFAGPGVQVTSARFVVRGRMYPINAITSVAPFTAQPSRTIVYVGALLMLLGLLSLAGSVGFGVLLILAAIACIAIGATRKPTHGVIIYTAGMQVRALTSPNFALVQQVVASLHQAVASR